MLVGKNIYRSTTELRSSGATVILFSVGSQVMAEIIGPHGHDDAIEPMPHALTFAHSRCGRRIEVFILDDEGLWQPEWGSLQR